MSNEIAGAQGLKHAKQSLLSSTPSTSLAGAHRVDITTIPNEILLEIFDRMLPDPGRGAFTEAEAMIRSISMVCRRFREMLLLFPKVWGYVQLDFSKEEVLERHLVRSGKAPLFIDYSYAETEEHILLRALEHKDRWVYLDCGLLHYGDQDIFPWSHPSAVFPSLRTLRIYFDYTPGEERDFGWKFPRVEDLEVWRHIPASSIFDLNSLATFKYFSGHTDNGTFLRSLTGFLEPANCLRTLHLDISNIVELFGPGDEPRQIVLPSVIDFTVTNLDCFDRRERRSALYYTCIFRVLRTPKVQKISMSMLATYTAHLNVYEWLVAAFTAPKELEYLTGFDFHLRCWNVDDPCCIQIYDFFRFFLRLRDLSVNAEDCRYSFINDGPVRLDHLRSLRLKDWECDQEVVAVFQNMKLDGADLEEVQIRSKGLVLDWESLQSIFPRASIEVDERYWPLGQGWDSP